MELLAIWDIHNYNTRNKDMLRLPRVTRNWGKQKVCHHSLKDWSTDYRGTKRRVSVNICSVEKNSAGIFVSS